MLKNIIGQDLSTEDLVYPKVWNLKADCFRVNHYLEVWRMIKIRDG